MARVRREPCAFEINQTTGGRHIGRPAPPIKRAKASARASRGQATDPNAQRTDMTGSAGPLADGPSGIASASELGG